jgi:hypothetical protein
VCATHTEPISMENRSQAPAAAPPPPQSGPLCAGSLLGEPACAAGRPCGAWWVALDVGTTGFGADAEPTEMAAVAQPCGAARAQVRETFAVRVWSAKVASRRRTRGRVYALAEPFPLAYARLVRWAAELPAGARRVLAAHNGRRFDLRVLARAVRRHGVAGSLGAPADLGADAFLDTLEWFRRMHPGESATLGAMYARLHSGSIFSDAHHCLPDAAALADCLAAAGRRGSREPGALQATDATDE